MRSLGVTASRTGMTEPQLRSVVRLLRELHPRFLHHGDCVGGDAEVAYIARRLGAKIVAHPPKVKKWRAFFDSDYTLPVKDYRPRNIDIVAKSDAMLVLPSGTERDQPRSGTWMTKRLAHNAGLVYWIITPSGEVSRQQHRLYTTLEEENRALRAKLAEKEQEKESGNSEEDRQQEDPGEHGSGAGQAAGEGEEGTTGD